ncbi:hypothetical protein BU23DRAFT_568213 [Bimuria novae-zelandiae CBS 107.79]|uniref:Uncharacterized protein n=1 Tax=Bimuria novae-zelandiae CBS 107.79 TaxID=1447943 RepID=A0A6A5V8I8_9PLEO|nr:hypothetical protein BU23DRAFT_568213 [Bimuria novae-zelandiae CBS 107.79]
MKTSSAIVASLLSAASLAAPIISSTPNPTEISAIAQESTATHLARSYHCSSFTAADLAWLKTHPTLSSVLVEACKIGALYAPPNLENPGMGNCREGMIGCKRSPSPALSKWYSCDSFTTKELAWIKSHPALASVLEDCKSGALYAPLNPNAPGMGDCREGMSGCSARPSPLRLRSGTAAPPSHLRSSCGSSLA